MRHYAWSDDSASEKRQELGPALFDPEYLKPQGDPLIESCSDGVHIPVWEERGWMCGGCGMGLFVMAIGRRET